MKLYKEHLPEKRNFRNWYNKIKLKILSKKPQLKSKKKFFLFSFIIFLIYFPNYFLKKNTTKNISNISNIVKIKDNLTFIAYEFGFTLYKSFYKRADSYLLVHNLKSGYKKEITDAKRIEMIHPLLVISYYLKRKGYSKKDKIRTLLNNLIKKIVDNNLSEKDFSIYKKLIKKVYDKDNYDWKLVLNILEGE